jgi:hypothetical protein
MNTGPAILIEAADDHFAWMPGEADDRSIQRCSNVVCDA